MKFIMLRIRKRRKFEIDLLNEKKIEKTLFFSFVTTFTILVVVQIVQMLSATNGFLVSNKYMEGYPLGAEEYLYDEGELVLKLVGESYCNNLYVLVNGSHISNFEDQIVSLNVKNGDVIEIDASGVNQNVSVEIVDISKNINRGLLGKRIELKSGIGILAKVRLN